MPIADGSCCRKHRRLFEPAMLTAAFKALGDVLSPEFRTVLAKAIGLTLAMFVAVFVAVEIVLRFLQLVPWAWAETVIAILAGLGLILAFIFLAAPVTAM